MIRRLGALMMILALVLCTGPAAAGAEAPETLDINGLKIRPGMTAFSTLKGRQEPRYTAEDVAEPLTQYCPDLLALDLGHNDVSDLSFVKAWPKLRRLIVVDSKTPITDISPLAELEDLEYVELFMQNIMDISALAGKTHLIDLNLAHNDITDLTPLHSCTGLKRLWISYNRHLSDAQIKAFQEAVPECRVVNNEWNSTGRGWRETAKGPVPHYRILMESFRSGEYIPFEDSAPLTAPEEEPAGETEDAEPAEGGVASDGVADEEAAAADEAEGGAPVGEAAGVAGDAAGTEAGAGSTGETGAAETADQENTEDGASGRPEAARREGEKTNSRGLLRNGGSFVYVLQEDGTILGWGDNRMGQLGTKPTKLLLTPRTVADGLDGRELADIQCGNENTLFLTKDGLVYTCGTYSRGTQGLGRLDSIVKTPTRIPGLERIVQISCGFGHNAALDADGHIWIWGRNDHGQLGVGDKTARSTPVMLPLEGIAAVNCGGKFTLAQDREGTLWGWGTNTYQVLAEGQKQSYSEPIRLEGFEDKKIVSFSGGSDCAFWLDAEGTVWTRGRNEYRQLGSQAAEWKTSPKLTTVDIPEKVRTVCAYSAATAALTENGNVWIWGSVSAGQLGNGTIPNGVFPVLCWDKGDAVEIAMGSLISSLRTADGKIWLTGYNAYGQMGDGTKRSTYTWLWNGTTIDGKTEE